MTDTEAPKVWDNGTVPHASLAEALAAFQTELPKLTKDEKAKVKGETKDGRSYDRSYGYADLAQVVETVLPVLGKHGLSVTSKNIFTSDGYILRVTLLHENGESDFGDWPLPDPRQSGPQDIGSAMTYGRRYLTLALSGAYPGGEDDDGAKAQGAPRERWEDAHPRTTLAVDRQQQAGEEPQAAPTAPAPKTSWTDVEIYDIQAKMTTATLDKTVGAYDWMAGKGLHNRAVSSPDGKSTDTATRVLALRLADEAMLPDTPVAAIEGLKAIAADRGLLKIQVSETETLDQVLYEARELAAHAAAETAGPVESASDLRQDT